MIIKPPLRGIDAFGSGAFGATRRRSDGSRRTHNGVDIAVPAGSVVYAPISGRVIRVGRTKYPGPIDLIEIDAVNGERWRVLYLTPAFTESEVARKPQVLRDKTQIGKARSLQDRYPGITDHLHIDVKRGDEYVDPTLFLYREG